METFIAFVKKEFKHIFRDTRSLLVLFGMPIAQVLLFGFAISTEIKESNFAVLDHDKSSRSIELIKRLDNSEYFKLNSYIYDNDKIENVFRDGETKFALVIPQGFSKEITTQNEIKLQLILDSTDPNTANIISQYLQNSVLNYYKSINYNLNYSGVEIESRFLYNPENKSVYMFVPGVMTVILMLVSAMMTSITVAREKERGTMEILLVSPLKPSLIIIGKVIPYLALSIVNAITILLLGLFVFGMPMNGSYALLWFEILLFITTTLSLGILISTATNSQQAAMMISLMGLMLPTILLSGFIFPIESMPVPLQVISNIVPAKWFIVIIKSIMLKGVGFASILKETAILIFMNIFLIAMSVKKFKIRLE
jgi:ABC-2 type transport system permease protein